MADLIQSTTGEVLGFYENDGYDLIKGLSCYVKQGTYLQLPTQEFIVDDLTSVEKSVNYVRPEKMGYLSNNVIIEFDASYEV